MFCCAVTIKHMQNISNLLSFLPTFGKHSRTFYCCKHSGDVSRMFATNVLRMFCGNIRRISFEQLHLERQNTINLRHTSLNGQLVDRPIQLFGKYRSSLYIPGITITILFCLDRGRFCVHLFAIL